MKSTFKELVWLQEKKYSPVDFYEFNKSMFDLIFDIKRFLLSEDIPPNLSLMEYLVVFTVYFYGPMKMRDISQKVTLTQSAITVIVDKLEKEGYVRRERDSDDRRVINIISDEKGIEFCDQGLQNLKKMYDKGIEVLTDKEQESFLRMLTKISDSLKQQK
ncbi:MAG TPA: MarR family transcriptional regulator [Petrotogaceae bacterium]|nr:MarR family transcriptional regulator [Petrotogaceae bacterium]